jgi:hypothetical protein
LEAAYLYNFARFVTWPATTAPTGEPLHVLIVSGEDCAAIAGSLDNRRVEERSIVATCLSESETLPPADIAYFRRLPPSLVSRHLHLSDGKAVLTVSDAPNFLKKGGMIRVWWEDGRFVFSVNRGAMNRAGLSASSQMLRFARSVQSSAAEILLSWLGGSEAGDSSAAR